MESSLGDGARRGVPARRTSAAPHAQEHSMKKWLALLLLLAAPAAAVAQSARTPKTAAAPVKYGSNPAAGHTFTHDGVRLYYEVYGTGEPLLLVHPNGGSIG